MDDPPRCPYCLGRLRPECGWRLDEPDEVYVWWRCRLDTTHITSTLTVKVRT